MNDLSDSELIALYHEGKLDGDSMNQLERRALDDPFLADALEGFSRAHRPRIVIKKDLKERLDNRLHKNKRRSIIGQTASWAAAAAIVLAVGATWFWFHEEKENRLVNAGAKAPLPPPAAENDTVKEAPAADAPQIAVAPPVAKKPAIQSASPIKLSSTVKKLPDSVMLGEVAVVAYETQHKKDLAGSVTGVSADVLSRQKDAAKEEAFAAAAPAARLSNRTVNGRVIASDDGKPLPGVNLILQGKKTSVVTNADGRFSLPADTGDVISARYIGYQSAQKSITKTDSLIIAMQPADQSLNEVVIVGYGMQKKTIKAEPVNGWKAYREYLEEETDSKSSGGGGKVVLEFTVDNAGRPSEFSVIRSAAEKLTQRAKTILSKGPKWQRGTAANERIRISLKFK